MDYGRNDHSIALNKVSSNSIDLILNQIFEGLLQGKELCQAYTREMNLAQLHANMYMYIHYLHIEYSKNA